MKLIVICKANIASVNIAKAFAKYELPKSVKILEVEDNVLDLDKHKEKFDELNPEIIVVLSSHASKAGVNSFSAHPTGNFDSNDLGGEKHRLSIAPADYIRTSIAGFRKYAEEKGCSDYDVTIEVTHHSPTIDYPVIFIEIGSNEQAWNDELAAEVVANVAYDLATKPLNKGIPAVGFGGNHYAPRFQKMIEEKGYSFGHMCPKHKIENLDEEMVLEIINKTIPKPEEVVLDWKGMNSTQRNKIIEILERNNIRWVRA